MASGYVDELPDDWDPQNPDDVVWAHEQGLIGIDEALDQGWAVPSYYLQGDDRPRGDQGRLFSDAPGGTVPTVKSPPPPPVAEIGEARIVQPEVEIGQAEMLPQSQAAPKPRSRGGSRSSSLDADIEAIAAAKGVDPDPAWLSLAAEDEMFVPGERDGTPFGDGEDPFKPSQFPMGDPMMDREAFDPGTPPKIKPQGHAEIWAELRGMKDVAQHEAQLRKDQYASDMGAYRQLLANRRLGNEELQSDRRRESELYKRERDRFGHGFKNEPVPEGSFLYQLAEGLMFERGETPPSRDEVEKFFGPLLGESMRRDDRASAEKIAQIRAEARRRKKAGGGSGGAKGGNINQGSLSGGYTTDDLLDRHAASGYPGHPDVSGHYRQNPDKYDKYTQQRRTQAAEERRHRRNEWAKIEANYANRQVMGDFSRIADNPFTKRLVSGDPEAMRQLSDLARRAGASGLGALQDNERAFLEELRKAAAYLVAARAGKAVTNNERRLFGAMNLDGLSDEQLRNRSFLYEHMRHHAIAPQQWMTAVRAISDFHTQTFQAAGDTLEYEDRMQWAKRVGHGADGRVRAQAVRRAKEMVMQQEGGADLLRQVAKSSGELRLQLRGIGRYDRQEGGYVGYEAYVAQKGPDGKWEPVGGMPTFNIPAAML